MSTDTEISKGDPKSEDLEKVSGLENYLLELNEHNGLRWKIDITETNYEILTNFINQILSLIDKIKFVEKQNIIGCGGYNARLSMKDVKNLHIILTKNGETIFDEIKDGLSKGNVVEIKTKNGYFRLIVYLLCKIFLINYETIKETVDALIPCTDFLPCNKNLPREKHKTRDFYPFGAEGDSDFVCGCEYAPAWFSRNHVDNNYDDTISYSKSYRIRKTGVKLTFDKA